MKGLRRFALKRAGRAVVVLAVGLGAAPGVALAVEVAALQLNTKSVAGGTTVQVGIGLASPAPLGGQVVSLLYSTTSVLDRPPAAVTIPGGSTGGSFLLATLPTAATTAVKIGARVGSVLKDATLTVRKPEVKALRLTTRRQTDTISLEEPLGASVTGGTGARLYIDLDGVAPPQGLAVQLHLTPYTAFQLCRWWLSNNTEWTCYGSGLPDDSSCAQRPSDANRICSAAQATGYSVIFAAGTSSWNQELRLGPVRDSQNVTISASAGVPKSVALRLHQPIVYDVEFATSCNDEYFRGISSVAQPTDLVARVYTKQDLPPTGAYARLSLSTAAAPIPATVEINRTFQWRAYSDQCNDPLRYGFSTNCLEQTYHVGCVRIPADVQRGTPRRLTLTATTGDYSNTATLDVGLVK